MFNDFKALIKNTKFRYLWGSQLLSQLTIHMMNFLLLARIFSETGSAIATSFLWISYALAAILVGPIAAAAVDMVPRRKMLMTTNLLQAATIFLYGFVHDTRFFVIFLVAFTYSLLNQFYVPAEQASLPNVVAKKSLPFANSLFFLTQQGAIIFGFGFAGIINKVLGYETSLFFCAFLLLMAFVSVSFLPEMRVRSKIPARLDEGIIKFFSRMLEGYRFIKENRQILTPFMLLLSVQVASAIVIVNVPVIASQIFLISLNLASIMIVVPAAVGAILGAILVSKLLKKGLRKKKAIEIFLFVLGVAFTGYALLVPGLPRDSRLLMGVVITMLVGMSFVGIVVPSQTFLQEATPGGLRGRVFGNFWFLTTLATLIPILASATITEVFGAKTLLMVLSTLAFTTVAVSVRFGQKFMKGGYV